MKSAMEPFPYTLHGSPPEAAACITKDIENRGVAFSFEFRGADILVRNSGIVTAIITLSRADTVTNVAIHMGHN